MTGIYIKGWIKALTFAALCASLFIAAAFVFPCLDLGAAGDQDESGSQKAFAGASQVFFHPRCLNCHPSGDAPLIRDDSQPHLFGVKRGPEGKGSGMLNCTLCHQEKNRPDGPPGAVGWHMPPEDMPMIFQGRTVGQLCRQLKDPKQNGGRTGEQVIDHIDKDPRVLWAWDPGRGRTVPKMSHQEFSAMMHEWVNKGCACPE